MFDFVFTADRKYRFYLGVALQSIIGKLPKEQEFCVHIIESDWNDRDKRDLSRLLDRKSSAQLDFYSIDPDLFGGLPLLPHISLDAYSRILSPEIVPRSKLYYFDCDILCLSSDFLFAPVELEDPLAAVFHRNSIMGEGFLRRMDLDGNPDYFNSGVLVIDADRWRIEAASEKMIEWMHSNTDRLVFGDQDTLNYYFRGRTKPLPLEWNLEERHYFERDCGFPIENDLALALARPGIVHFTGVDKPWKHSRRVNYLSSWEKVASEVAVATGWQIPTSNIWRRFGGVAIYGARCCRGRIGAVRKRLDYRLQTKF